MIQFTFRGDIPHRLAADRIHLVTSRSTIFGVHKPININGNSASSSVSKTALIAFLEKEDAVTFMKRLKKQQENKQIVDRCVMDGDTLYTSVSDIRGGSLMPLKLESSFSVGELQILCFIHYFDMYLAFTALDNKDHLDIVCYSHETSDLPNRSTIDNYMEDMYRKQSNRQ